MAKQAKQQQEKPVFLVNVDGGEGKTANRLIRAANSAQARGHIVKELIAVRRATATDLNTLGAEGVAIEDASTE